MPIQVPKIEQPPRPLGESLIPTILSAILWPKRQQAAQESQTEGLQKREEESTAEIIKAIQSNPNLLAKLGAPATPGILSTAKPESDLSALVNAPSGMQKASDLKTIESMFPAKQPYGTSARTYGNILSEYGLPGGRVQTVPTTTPEGGQILGIKAPGTVISTPGGLQANIQAKQAPKLIQTTGPNGQPQQEFVNPEAGKVLSAAPMRFRYREIIPGSGIKTDTMTGQTVIFPDGRTPVPMSVSQEQQSALKFLESKPNAQALAMKQMAPSVHNLITSTRVTLEKAKTQLGPASGRLASFIAERVGAGDPEYIALAANLELVPTIVGKMHFGARAPVEVINRFRAHVDPGHMAAENIIATLDAWDLYAEGESQKQFTPSGIEFPSNAAPAPPMPPVQQFQPLPGEKYEDYIKRATAAGVK